MIDEYLRQLQEKGYSKDAIRGYRRVLGCFRNCGFTKKSIQDYQMSIQHLKVKSQKSYLTSLKTFLHNTNPKLEKYIVIPKPPKELPKNIPEQDKVRQIVQQPETWTFIGIRDRAIIELFYSGGIRRKELVNIKLSDLDLQKQILRINQGKMGKDRIIPLSGKAIKWLRKYIEQVRPSLNPQSEHLFLSVLHGTQMYEGTPNKILKKYGEYSCHKYRHAYATHLLQNGMKETTLQKLLGHSQVSTTQIYTKVTINELKKSYRKYHPRDKWKVG